MAGAGVSPGEREAAGSRPAHRPSRRSEIVRAAIDEFAETGVATATVADVARRAGMTPAAVYYHFPTREDLVVEVVRHIGAQVQRSADVHPGDEVLQGSALFDRVLDDYGRWVDEHPEEARILWVEAVGLSPVVEAARRETLTALVERTIELLGLAGFHLADTDAEVTALALVTLVLSAMQLRFRTDGPVPTTRQLREAISHVGRALLGPGPAPASGGPTRGPGGPGGRGW